MSVDDILTIKLNSNDNVATAFNNIAKGEITQHIKVENDIPKGHKIVSKMTQNNDPQSFSRDSSNDVHTQLQRMIHDRQICN